MRILAFMNQKGGVGKTTSTLNIAAALGATGKRTLVIDLDPQANLTRSVGLDPENISASVMQLLKGEAEFSDVLQRVGAFDILPSNISLASAEGWLNSISIGRESMLKDSILAHAKKYDFVLIDCPPALGNLTTNAMVAATDLVIVVMTDNYSRYGTTDLMKHLQAVKRANPELRVLGVIANAYDARRKMDKDVLEMFRDRFVDAEGRSLVFNTPVRSTVSLREAPASHQDIFTFKPDSHGAEDFKAVADELLTRI